MEKALEILKNCRQKGQKRAGGLDLDEAIAELEEAQLTRREWYQKGYKEAMNHKKCGCCKHYEKKQCTNENSIAFGGINAVYKDDFCNDFEPKDNA